MPLRAEVDPKLCIGSSNCVEEAPAAFELNEQGLARVLGGAVSEEELLRGARACPVSAIRLYEIATHRRVFP